MGSSGPRRTTKADGDLAELGVVAPHDRRRRHHGIRADDLLDLAGEDLLAAPVDHVVGPGVEVDEPVVVLMPEIPRPQPAVLVEAVPVRVARRSPR